MLDQPRRWRYQHMLDNDYLEVEVPHNLSEADVGFMEEHFALIVKQAKRRAVKDGESNAAIQSQN